MLPPMINMPAFSALGRFSRVLIVYNPVAGGRHLRVETVINGLVAMGCLPELVRTGKRGDAALAAQTAAARGFELIIAAGGDGTINEVANGLAASGTKVPLAFLPLGTANVLAAEVGLQPTAEAVLDTIAGGRRRLIRLGVAGDQHFVLMASAGLDAAVVHGVDLALKRRAGQLAYGLEALRQAFAYRFPELTATIDGVPHRARMVVACRARCYGGPFQVAPQADLTADVLQVVILKRGGLVALIRYAVALALGRLCALPDVEIVAGRSLVLEGPADAPVQTDGDPAGMLPTEIRVSDQVIELLVP